MNLPEWFSPKDIDALRSKVMSQKFQGTEHITGLRQKKRDQFAKLLEQPEEVGKLKVHTVWQNLNLRKSIFLRDQEDVRVIHDQWAIGQKVSDNANKVIQFDWIDMWMRQYKEQIITDDGMFGLAGLMIDGYDEIEQQPIVSVINPLTCYGDPNASCDSKMQYFGTEVLKNYYELYEDKAYFNLDKLHSEYSQAIQDFKNSVNSANKTTTITIDQVNEYNKNSNFAVINHICSFKWKLYLSTWWASGETLVRIIEIRDLDNKENKRPDKLSLWVSLFRSAPIPYSFFGASIFDEILQNQDLATMLVNLQVKLAQRVSLWGNKYIDSRAGFNLDMLSSAPIAGQTIVSESDIGTDLPLSQMIYQEQKEPASQFPLQVMQLNDSIRDNTVWFNGNLVAGISQGWSQTKAEVQTLQENINVRIGLIGDNYLWGWKNFWYDIMKCYSANMSKTDKKKITLFSGQWQDSYTFKKSDFVPSGKIQIHITSKVQEDIQDERDFARLSVLHWFIAPNLKANSAKFNEWFRGMIDKSGIKGLKGVDMFSYNKDERKAQSLIELINTEEYEKNLLTPEETDDLNFIIEKLDLAIDNEQRNTAIRVYTDYRDKLEAIQPPEPAQMTQWNWQSSAMANNMLASKDNSNVTPSLWQIS